MKIKNSGFKQSKNNILDNIYLRSSRHSVKRLQTCRCSNISSKTTHLGGLERIGHGCIAFGLVPELDLLAKQSRCRLKL